MAKKGNAIVNLFKSALGFQTSDCCSPVAGASQESCCTPAPGAKQEPCCSTEK